MKTTTKLALAAGAGLAVLTVGIVALAGGTSAASKLPPAPTPPLTASDATSFTPGRTYEFSFIDPTKATTAFVQNFLKAGGWQVQSLTNMGAQSGGGATGTGYIVTALYSGTVAVTPPALGDPLVLARAIGPM